MIAELLGRLVGRGSVHGGFSGRRRRTAPRSRLSIPSVVPQIPDVLRRLRWLRDDLDYYTEQDGWILLLAWDPTKERVREARKMLGLGLDTFDNRIMLEGFSILAMLEPHAVWSGRLLECAQNIIDKATYRKVEAAHDTRMREADGTMNDLRGEAHMRDALTSDSKSDHRILFRGAKSFSSSTIRRAMGQRENDRASKRQAEFLKSVELMKRYNVPILSQR